MKERDSGPSLFIMVLLALLGLTLVSVFGQGCASYPHTPAPIPAGSVPTALVEDWDYTVQPEDETKVETTVGAMRKALIIGERYTDAVAAQNNAVGAASELESLYKYAVEGMKQTEEVGRQNTVTAGWVGFGLGATLVGIISVLLGR